MTALRRRLLAASAAIVLLSCTACATPEASAGPATASESPDASEAPSASAEPAPVAARVVVEADQLVLASADGAEIETLAFSSDPLAARGILTEWFGAAPETTEVVSTHYCADQSTPTVTDVWGDDLSIVHAGQALAALGVRFAAYVDGPEVGGLGIEAFDGSAVGDAPDALIAALDSSPGAYADAESGLTRIYFDVPNPDYSAYAYAFDGEPIAQIIAPYALEETC